MMSNRWFRTGLTIATGVLMFTLPAHAADKKVRIIQTNSAGDNIHIIDPVTNKVVGEIKGIEASHGIAVSPDGTRIYISEEAEKTLTVVDGKTLQVTKQIPLKIGRASCRERV